MSAREARVSCLRLAAASGGGLAFFLDQFVDDLVDWIEAAKEAFPDM